MTARARTGTQERRLAEGAGSRSCIGEPSGRWSDGLRAIWARSGLSESATSGGSTVLGNDERNSDAARRKRTETQRRRADRNGALRQQTWRLTVQLFSSSS